jgi:hypothetical protein
MSNLLLHAQTHNSSIGAIVPTLKHPLYVPVRMLWWMIAAPFCYTKQRQGLSSCRGVFKYHIQTKTEGSNASHQLVKD